MPRNGDGSGDSGPINGHEIIHGNTGDATLEHTQHVAPMPKIEKGEALPGMNASGGAAAPLNSSSEEYGSSAPRNERSEDNETQKSKSSSGGQTSTASSHSSSDKSAKSNSHQADKTPSHGGKSDHQNQSSNKDYDERNLESISREKAERYVNLNEEDVEHAGSGNKSSNDAERSSQRAPRDAGSKEDTEKLHGKAQGGKANDKDEKKSGTTGRRDSGKSENLYEGQEFDQETRHKAEKFVNLDE